MGYFAPRLLTDALAAVAEEEAEIVGGGTDFFPSLKPGRSPRNIIDVTGIREIRGLSKTAAGWRIGAAATWAEIADHPLPGHFDCLRQAARTVGSVQIQNAATIGGNICNASPAADGIPPLLALDAQVEIRSRRASRTVPLGEFITGVRKTGLSGGELVTAVLIPDIPQPAGSSFVKLGSRKYLVISIAMAAAVVSVKDGHVADARIAVGSCSPVAARLPLLEAGLRGMKAAGVAGFEISEKHLAPLSPISDIRGTAEYRKNAVKKLCRRAVAGAISDG